MSSTIITLCSTFASLLSGNLMQCFNASDPECEGGMAAVSALVRQNNVSSVEKQLVIPRIDTQSPFVQMHPQGWSVNRKVIQEIMGWRAFSSSVSLVSNEAIREKGELEGLQSLDWPLLMTNVALLPSNSWTPFVDHVLFDEQTRLAVLSIIPDAPDSHVTTNQLDAARARLDYIARVNEEQSMTTNSSSSISSNVDAWVPVVYFAEPNSKDGWEAFRLGVLAHEHPPALLLDIEGNALDEYPLPTRVNNTWILSYRISSGAVHQFHLTCTKDGKISDVQLQETSLEGQLNETYRDAIYQDQILRLRALADEALENDPVVGYSGFVPLTRDSGDTRVCMGGECVIGNLFTDALRWYTETDIAFIPSGGLRGPGWEAGEVHVSDIWLGLPFGNNVCTGVFSGISLFKLFNYSLSQATFESTYTPTGDNLLQVSGARIIYNTELPGGSRLIDIQIYDADNDAYAPIERLRLYKFATDSFLCGVFQPYPQLLSDVSLDGEVPGKIDTESLIHQFIVSEYLKEFHSDPSTPYVTAIQGRLSNDTSATKSLNLVERATDCVPGTTWQESILSCVPCPESSDNVAFSDSEFYLEAERGEILTSRVVLVNREVFNVSVRPKVVPDFVTLTNFSLTENTRLLSGQSIAVEFNVDTSGMGAGTAQSTVSFGVLEGALQGCLGRDVSFGIKVLISPESELNELGNLAIAGFTLAAIVMLTAATFTGCVIYFRKERVLKTLQPLFLLQMCGGIFIIGSSMIPFSIDDVNASPRGADIACAATPWLLSIGFTIAFSALFTKLWRINKLFNPKRAFRRAEVREQDVLKPFMVLLACNLIFLIVWTVVDPWKFERVVHQDEPWSSHGVCTGDGAVSKVMLSLIVVVNGIALILACFQAYLARNIRKEFSESKHLGIALYSWVQVLIVGGPVIFLLDTEYTVRYFVVVAIIFSCCMSMMLLVFLPIFFNLKGFKDHHSSDGGSGRSSGRYSMSTRHSTRQSVHVSGLYNNTTTSDGSAMNESLKGVVTEEQDELRNQLALLQSSISQLREKNWELEDRNGELQSLLERSSSEFTSPIDGSGPLKFEASDDDLEAGAMAAGVIQKHEDQPPSSTMVLAESSGSQEPTSSDLYRPPSTENGANDDESDYDEEDDDARIMNAAVTIAGLGSLQYTHANTSHTTSELSHDNTYAAPTSSELFASVSNEFVSSSNRSRNLEKEAAMFAAPSGEFSTPTEAFVAAHRKDRSESSSSTRKTVLSLSSQPEGDDETHSA